MYLRILILFLISLSLNAAEMVWDEDSANRTKKVSDKEYEQALVDYLVQLAIQANQDNAEALNSLGDFYYHGQGVKQGYREAARFYKLSAEQGYAIAQNNLGVLYQEGQGVKKDYKEAANLYRLSAKQGNKTAKKRLDRLCKAHPSACR